MRPKDKELYAHLDRALSKFENHEHRLVGIQVGAARAALLEQVIESVHRIEYVRMLLRRDIDQRRADPSYELFDPLKAAALNIRDENIEEAIWLVFLSVHFGKHRRGGWRYAREVYGRLRGPGRWDWVTVSTDPASFSAWLNANALELRRQGAGFGNHRKYQSLDAYSGAGTGAAIESYVSWVSPPRTQRQVLEQAVKAADGNPQEAFDSLFRSMRQVASFGRMARFDYLTMLGKLGLTPIVPGKAYLSGSTGPLAGARMLFGKQEAARHLDDELVRLDSYLNVGMQVLEDALCNWQKSPLVFKPFRG